MPEVAEVAPAARWYKSRTFWGAILICVPQIVEAAGVIIPEIAKTLIQTLGGVVGAVGIRGAILRSGGQPE